MTPDDRFGRSLATWLDEEARGRVPDHLGEVLVRTAATRQRPWWSSLERLYPMTSTTFGGRLAAPRPIILLAALAALLVAALGLALLAGSRQATPVPHGLAANGRIVVADGTTLVSYAADGTDRRVIAPANAGADTLSMSPDGTRVAFTVKTMPPSVHVVSLADGSTTDVDVAAADVLATEAVSWSPDGRSLTFTGLEGAREQLYVAAADGSSIATPIAGQLKAEEGIWQPAFSPDGAWIAFASRNSRTEFGSLYVVHPDGSGLRKLEAASVETGDGGGPIWSPAAGTHRIAYLTSHSGPLYTRVLDVDAGTDTEIGPGFWPSWSPDGTRLATCCTNVIDVDAAMAGHLNATQVFAPFHDNCGDDAALNTGRSVCSAVTWSPDGEWLIGADIAGKDLLLARSDGTSEARRIPLEAVSSLVGIRMPLAWQPVRP